MTGTAAAKQDAVQHLIDWAWHGVGKADSGAGLEVRGAAGLHHLLVSSLHHCVLPQIQRAHSLQHHHAGS